MVRHADVVRDFSLLEPVEEFVATAYMMVALQTRLAFQTRPRQIPTVDGYGSLGTCFSGASW